MTVEAIVETYARETPRKALPGKYVGFFGLTHEMQPPIRPWEDVVALYDIHGNLLIEGVYEGFRNPKNDSIGEYSLESIVKVDGTYRRSGERILVPVVPLRVERIGKVHDCGKESERIDLD